MRTTAMGPQVPRHSIAISLTLAVIAYCCCSALGIIPIVMVIFAYVKRENGKARDATRMSNYSRCVSGIVIAIGIILLMLTVLYFITYAYFSHYYNGGMTDYDYYPDDIVYPEDYNGSGGSDYIDEPYWEDGMDYVGEESSGFPDVATTDTVVQFFDEIIEDFNE